MAANFISYRIEGFEEAQARLAEFPARFRNNAMRGGLRAGLKILVDGARKRVPVRSGQLRKTIRSNTYSFKQGALLRGEVKAGGVNKGRKAKAYYAHIVEGGAKAHRIEARKQTAMAYGGRFAKSVQHPGTRATFFMRDTAKIDGPRAEKAFIAYVDKRVATYLEPK